SNIVWAGLFAALSVAIRLTNVFFLLASLGYIVASRWRIQRILAYAGAPMLVGLSLAFYNYTIFGNIRGVHAAHAFDTALLAGLSGLFVSPGRGLFVYSPFLLFIFVGIYMWLKCDRGFRAPIYTISFAFVVLHVVLVSRYFAWWGGWNYGPRYLTDVTPCLMILLLPGLDFIFRHRLAKRIFVLLAGVAVGIQMVGAFCYPRGHWDDRPVSVTDKPLRLWDWRDNPIFRNAVAGPYVGPYLNLVGLLKPLRTKDFKVSYAPVQGPAKMKVGENSLFKVTLSNSSSKAWITASDSFIPKSIHLSYHWYDLKHTVIIFDGMRTELPWRLLPGKPVEVALAVTAPHHPGQYILAIDLVQEGVAWFSWHGVKPAEVRVTVVQ
ncbi:MAG: hypothetical protein JSW39_15240, partial [Desulfobacterales bacterium]